MDNKKKTNDKKQDIKTKTNRRQTFSKMEKEIKIEEEIIDFKNNKKKHSEISPINSTPKSGIKSTDKNSAPSQKVIANFGNINITKNKYYEKKIFSRVIDKTNKKEISDPKKNQNLCLFINILENFMNNHNRNNISFTFNKIFNIVSQEFFTKLNIVKKEINDIINHNELFNENYIFILKFIENTANIINIKIKNANDTFTNTDIDDHKLSQLNLSFISDDYFIDYYYQKKNSVAFEIPIKRKRAMSENDEEYKNEKIIKLENRLNKKRLSSEEINQRIKIKLELAERNKILKHSQYQENANKIMTKIKTIKNQKKLEKQEKLQKLTEKLELINSRHQKYLIEKISKAKSEQEKVAEINFLNRMEKENKDFSIIKKLDISIERRQKHIMQRMSKTIQRNLKEEEAERKRKNDEEEYRKKLLKKIQKRFSKKEEIDLKVNDKIELVNKRKMKVEDQIEFLKSIYSENFIWEILQADYFNINDLCELSKITKFEIIKAKLKKDKELIDTLYEKNKSKSKFSSSHRVITDERTDLNIDYSLDYDSDTIIRHSKSFTIFDDNDFLEVDYLFKDNNNKKKKRRKKKKPEIIKNRLIKTINSLSQHDLTRFYTKMHTDKNIKKILFKRKNGRYIKSKIIITNETNIKESPKDNTDIDDEFSFSAEKKEKILKIVQNQDLKNDFGANTILINSDSLSNMLEKNSITVKWCKLCNLILANDQDVSQHIQKPEHKKLKLEYNLSLHDDSSLIMIFQSFPGDISEELRNERINTIKVRFKKIKQKLSLRSLKHENFWTYKQDFPSANKQRIQKISFDIEKQITNIKDYDLLESILKDLIKILEQKKQNDLHIMRGLKIVSYLVDILKKPAVCHKSEIKNLAKIIEIVLQILMYFSSIIENRNYMLVTNRMTNLVDLLLWVLNKPTKIPLGISFLPDLIYLITVHIKHKLPFEYINMKDDFLEYLCLSNVLVKFKHKYINITGPIDLTSGFGSFPLVLLKSLSMIEALTYQVNINYCSKPVYVKSHKISENILFVLEYTELIGIIQLLSTLLLSNGPIKPKCDKDYKNVLPHTVISATVIGTKILNNIARLDLSMFQFTFNNNNLLQEQLYHVINYIINYSIEELDHSDDIKELLHETILLLGYVTLLNDKMQSILAKGEITLIQKICSLPFSYFSDKKLRDILFPSLIIISYQNTRNMEILNKEINFELLIMYIKEKIQLEPIIEEEEYDKLDESKDDIIYITKDQFISNINSKELGLKKRTLSFSSNASSTKSCNDMVTGVSDYVLFYHRFPRNLWEISLEYISKFEK